jgi:hypothetical protein
LAPEEASITSRRVARTLRRDRVATVLIEHPELLSKSIAPDGTGCAEPAVPTTLTPSAARAPIVSKGLTVLQRRGPSVRHAAIARSARVGFASDPNRKIVGKIDGS